MKDLWEFFSRLRASTYSRVTVEMIYVDMVDDLNAGILLSQLVYWYLPSNSGESKLKVLKENEYWVSKSYDEWFEEVRLKKRPIMRAVGILEEKDIIKTKVFRFNGAPTVHYQLNTNKFITLLTIELEKLGKNPESAQSARSKVQKVHDGKFTKGTIESAESARFLTDTTTDITTDKKKSKSENLGEVENLEMKVINFKLKHFTPKTQREIHQCLAGFDVTEKIKKITNDVFKDNYKIETG